MHKERLRSLSAFRPPIREKSKLSNVLGHRSGRRLVRSNISMVACTFLSRRYSNTIILMMLLYHISRMRVSVD